MKKFLIRLLLLPLVLIEVAICFPLDLSPEFSNSLTDAE